jgi:hypothetical protein
MNVMVKPQKREDHVPPRDVEPLEKEEEEEDNDNDDEEIIFLEHSP